MAAAKVSWDSKLELEQSCRLCRRPEFEATRAAWGCDQDAPTPTLVVRCWECAPKPTKDCGRCAGTGTVAWHRCPRSTIDGAAFAAVRAVDLAVDLKMLPRAGGWDDQHPAFHDVFWLLIGERSRYERERISGKPDPEPRHDPAPAIDPYGYLRTPDG
jgi:hypothetical protein